MGLGWASTGSTLSSSLTPCRLTTLLGGAVLVMASAQRAQGLVTVVCG